MAKRFKTIRIKQSKFDKFYQNTFNQFRIVGNVFGEVEKSVDDMGIIQGTFILDVKGEKMPITLKGKYAENLASQIKPSDLVGVFGYLTSRKYQGEYILELNAKEVELLIKGKDSNMDYQKRLNEIENFYDPRKITERLENVK